MKLKINTLRSFITFAVSMTVSVALLGAGTFFYIKSSNILKDTYKKDITHQLQQINTQVEDQIGMIDSVFPLIMSNTLIREYLDPASESYDTKSEIEKKLEIERQLSYLLISTYLWDKKFINAVSIFQDNGNVSKVSLYKDRTSQQNHMATVYKEIKKNSALLEIRTLESDKHSIYFIRNIKSTYTGENIATIVIDINQEAWKQSYGGNTDEHWLICIFNQDMYVLNHEGSELERSYEALMEVSTGRESMFQDIQLEGTRYYMASRMAGGITSAVAVPENYLMNDLNKVLKTFLTIIIVIIFMTLLFTVILSHLITAPIEKMIAHIKMIADGVNAERVVAPVSMYSEFNQLASAFQTMLMQLDISYNDNFQKQLLLKNTEIKALQSQMDPHFLFNILDTIAWKAQMNGNEEIYQMIISLGELLRSNILSHEQDFVALEDELTYVRFYIYLQQIRFEDKFIAEIHMEDSLNDYLIPRFSIQPLVENAIIHGLEAKKGFGKLIVNIINQGDLLEINVIDDGVGFEVPDDLNLIQSKKDDSHTHIGLKNLNKRLSLLFGEDAKLQVVSIRNQYTSATFQIPKSKQSGSILRSDLQKFDN